MRRGGYSKDHFVSFAEYRQAAQERKKVQSKARLLILGNRIKKPISVSSFAKTTSVFASSQYLCIQCNATGSISLCQICEQNLCSSCVKDIHGKFSILPIYTGVPTCSLCFESLMLLEREKQFLLRFVPSAESVAILKCYTTASSLYQRLHKSFTHFQYLSEADSLTSQTPVPSSSVASSPSATKETLNGLCGSISKDLALLRQLLTQIQSLTSRLTSRRWKAAAMALNNDFTHKSQTLTVSYERAVRILGGADAGVWSELRVAVRKLSINAKTSENFQRVYGACFSQLAKIIEEEYQKSTSSSPEDSLSDADLIGGNTEAHFEGTLMRQTLYSLRQLSAKARTVKATRSCSAIDKFISLLSQEYEGTLQSVHAN